MTQSYLLCNSDLWEKINSDFGNTGGVYKLFGSHNGENIPIERVLKVDPFGVLYIGMANNFLNRVIDLKKSICPGYISANHDFGVRYKANIEFTAKFPCESLKVELSSAEDPIKAEMEELENYLKEFGERPPFNRM